MSGVTFNLKKTKSKMPAIKAAFKDYDVEAGILQSAGKHKDSDESVAQVALWNEYGTPKIPERPAFRSSFAKNQKKYFAMLKKMVGKGFKGRKLTMLEYEKLGKEARDDIQKSIVGGGWVPNAPSTQKAKGKGKQLINDPLVNTGQTVDSVDYRVKKK